MFASHHDRKDAREQEREEIRLQKRMLRDLRWAVERSTIQESDWRDLLALHQQYGKEGPLQMVAEVIPYWRDCQRVNKGADLPQVVLSEVFPQAMGLFSRTSGGLSPSAANVVSRAPATRTKATKGAPRKQRSDAGKRQPSRKGN